ncbi:mucin-2-like isoform X2 [Ananas comosus]|uniref:Mucin-2-like isoform X2 n=1 Tax=Ananas comosus TaxID=4615 RepID=A0A6P5ESG3_ANACO|nr:mucin-2-like isoform X2 [Ananas comosus]
MGRRRRRMMMILCPSVVGVLLLVLVAIRGPGVQLSKPLELHLLARRTLLPLTNAPPTNNTTEILDPSNMVAPSISPPPRNLDFDVSPPPYVSSSVPHTKDEASSPVYFKEPPKEYAPAPATTSEGNPVKENNLSPKPVFHGEAPYTNSSVPAPSKEVSLPLPLQPPTIPPSGFPHTSDVFPPAVQAVISSAQPSAPPYESPSSSLPSSHDLSPSYAVPPSARTGNGEAPKISPPVSVPRNKVLPPPQPPIPAFFGHAPSPTPDSPHTTNNQFPPTPITPPISRNGSDVSVAPPPNESSSQISPINSSTPNAPASNASRFHGNRYGSPIASPPKEPSTSLPPPSYSHLQGPAASSASTPNFNNSAAHSIPVAAPPKESSGHSSRVNSSRITGPASSPVSTPRVNNSTTHSIPVAAPPNESTSHSPPVNSTPIKGPASSPVSTPHVNNSKTHSIPVAAPPNESTGHSPPVNSSRIKGPAYSPSSTPNFNNSATHSIPVAAPPKESSGHSSPVNSSRIKGPASSPSLSPIVDNSTSHSIPAASTPKGLSTHPHVNSSHIEGPASSPASTPNVNSSTAHSIPVAAPPKESSSHSSPVDSSHIKGPAYPPALTPNANSSSTHNIPVAAPPKESSSHSSPVNSSHIKGPAPSPVSTPQVNNSARHTNPVASPPKEPSTHSSHLNYSRTKVSSPLISPSPHEAKIPPQTIHAPLNSPNRSPSGRTLNSPAPVPVSTTHNHKGRGTPEPAHAPFQPNISESPAASPKNNRRHHPSPPHAQGPSISQAPFHSADSRQAPSSSPSINIPSTINRRPVPSPMPPPSASTREKHEAPSPEPINTLPPPPPNLDCTPLSCSDPWTNSPPGSPCACVLPIKVGLRLNVALYTFFTLVSELAQELANGVLMKQSQVRIMGANAANEQPEKTVVFIDLIPLGNKFDNTTIFLVNEKFWHKEVFINASYFGDYDVLYVIYPGLSLSPPAAPGDMSSEDGVLINGNNPKSIRPLAANVRKHREKQSGSLIVIIILSAVFALVLCVGAAWMVFLKCIVRSHPLGPTTSFAKSQGTGARALGSQPSSASASFSSSIATCAGTAKTFSLAEMERATNKFDESKIIGEGGFGRVYKGTLDDGRCVAIKVLKREDQQGSREFLAEVEMLSRLHHRNLVKLLGICTEEHMHCLIYELIPNGSVESHLHGPDRETAPLDWDARLKIALGAARALAYLHEDSNPRVIHRDFKSSNILLEHDFTPKVSDFGLARAARDEAHEHISTRVMGTFGYVAPEYAMTGHLLVKSDVYSYGVVLLELLTGRKPVDMLRPPGQENLVTWARPLLTSKESLETIIDPSLDINKYDSLAKVAAIVSMCVQPEVDQRPFMGEVVQALKLVCNEGNEHKVSESFSREDSHTPDTELRLSGCLDMEAERKLSSSNVLSTSARFTRDATGSFRRISSSGPLRTSRGAWFWDRGRNLSGRSSSEHGIEQRFQTGSEGGESIL